MSFKFGLSINTAARTPTPPADSGTIAAKSSGTPSVVPRIVPPVADRVARVAAPPVDAAPAARAVRPSAPPPYRRPGPFRPTSPRPVAGSIARVATVLAELEQQASACTRCPLANGRTNGNITNSEATELLGPSLRTLAVKRGLGRFSARHLSPARARELLQQAAREAVENAAAAPIYTPGSPCTIMSYAEWSL